MLAIDTNVLVRFVTGDHRTQSAKARELIERNNIFVSHTVFLESEWVLRSAYGFSRADVCRALKAFAGLATVTVEAPAVLAEAIARTEAGADFADALHLAAARQCDAFVTLDRKLIAEASRRGEIPLREP